MWFLLDGSFVIRDINQAACHALNALERFAIGTPLRMWATRDSMAAIAQHMRSCRNAFDPVHVELRMKDRHGRVFPVRLTTRRSEFRGVIVFPTVAVDISEEIAMKSELLASERRRGVAEEDYRLAREADVAKDRLIAIVSHELRNPLSPALFAASSLVKWPGLPARVRDLAAVIQRNVELEARLIDDLLDVARVARGQLSLRTHVVDVHEVLGRAIEACAVMARERNLTMMVDMSATRHYTMADEARLQQVFWNLLSNAVKFSHPGGELLVRSMLDASQNIVVRIRDFGVGMAPDTLEQLFAPFERPRVPFNQRAGLGLGLTISKGIIEAHGGSIWATSEGVDQGSTFEVQLTTCEPPKAESKSSDETSGASPYAAKRGRVLIIEDHEDTGSLLTMFLSRHGYDVSYTSKLADGLAALDQQWDAVLSDIGLEDGSGLQIARQLKGKTAPKPMLIAVSGYGTQRDIAASLDAGFDRHLVKPVDPKELLQLLESEDRSG